MQRTSRLIEIPSDIQIWYSSWDDTRPSVEMTAWSFTASRAEGFWLDAISRRLCKYRETRSAPILSRSCTFDAGKSFGSVGDRLSLPNKAVSARIVTVWSSDTSGLRLAEKTAWTSESRNWSGHDRQKKLTLMTASSLNTIGWLASVKFRRVRIVESASQCSHDSESSLANCSWQGESQYLPCDPMRRTNFLACASNLHFLAPTDPSMPSFWAPTWRYAVGQ